MSETEIKRIANVQMETFTYHTPCLRCGKVVRLFWNGGELDRVECCGLNYTLEHVQVDLVVSEDVS